jgi:hypothetical protein
LIAPHFHRQRIGRFQAFIGEGKGAAALARELFDAYRTNKQTQRRMSEVLVALFEQSESFCAGQGSHWLFGAT